MGLQLSRLQSLHPPSSNTDYVASSPSESCCRDLAIAAIADGCPASLAAFTVLGQTNDAVFKISTGFLCTSRLAKGGEALGLFMSLPVSGSRAQFSQNDGTPSHAPSFLHLYNLQVLLSETKLVLC